MKNSNFDIAFQMADLQTYVNDPLWFKKSLLGVCCRDINGKAHHVEFLEIDVRKKQPIVTTLRYIRAIVPDALDPLDDEMIPEGKNIDIDTCIILIPNEKNEYVEPISQLQIVVDDLRHMAAEEIYNTTIAQNTFLTIGSNSDNFLPFGYVSEDIFLRWKEKTVPYCGELIAHFNKIKRRTENNFGYSYVKSEEITTLLNTLK